MPLPFQSSTNKKKSHKITTEQNKTKPNRLHIIDHSSMKIDAFQKCEQVSYKRWLCLHVSNDKHKINSNEMAIFFPNWIWAHSTWCAFYRSTFFRLINFEFSTHSHTFYAKTLSIQFVTLSLLSIDDIDVDLFLFHSSRRIHSSEMTKGSIFVFVFGDTLSLIDKSCWCQL